MVHVAQDDSFMAEVVSREKGGSPRRRGSKERGSVAWARCMEGDSGRTA
jgi:hypothetical protein